jgi:hypothetical protein
MSDRSTGLHISKSPGASVIDQSDGCWHLEIPASTQRTYHLAQLDDHLAHSRADFPWKPPLSLSLQARVSAQDLPGTWGFGFWNDPFSFLLGGDRTVKRLPTLPDAAWFFHASPENYLSFRDDLPACGFLAATFSSRRVSTILLALGSPALALALLPFTARPVRGSLRRLVHQDSSQLQVDVTAWHTYRLDWEPATATFSVDGSMLYCTPVSPPSPLSLVIWIDNQFASLPPAGRLRYGTLLNASSAWLEIREIELSSGD